MRYKPKGYRYGFREEMIGFRLVQGPRVILGELSHLGLVSTRFRFDFVEKWKGRKRSTSSLS